MTQFALTPNLKNTLETCLPKDEYDTLKSLEYIQHSKLINIYEKYHPTVTLLELIRQSKLYIPNRNISITKPKTKEYLELMEKLRLQEKEKEYKQLVQPQAQFDTLYEPTVEHITPAQMNKELKNYITTIVNILISVASVVYAIWYWTDTSWNLPDSYRVLLCLFFGLLILVAEVVVYLGYLNKIEDARKAERQKKEIKKVIKTL